MPSIFGLGSSAGVDVDVSTGGVAGIVVVGAGVGSAGPGSVELHAQSVEAASMAVTNILMWGLR
jgi:hypothetical protein